jgi:ribosome-associated toxin RatA of RatAB toxin-antitoxin module
MGLNWAEHSAEISAPIEVCFDAIVDYESFPRWQDAVDSVEVLSRTKDGLGEDVRLFVDAKVRKIDYTLRYRYQRPETIQWDFVEGNGMRDMGGAYSFEELGPGRCRATYNLGADPAIPVPGPVARRVHRQLVKRSVEDLKNEAERRQAECGGATESKPGFGFGKRKEAQEPTAEWSPKAARRTTESEEREEAGEPTIGAVTEIPGAIVRGALSAATNPVKASRDLAQSGLRAARSVAELAREVGKDAADRVDRRLSGRDRNRG